MGRHFGSNNVAHILLQRQFQNRLQHPLADEKAHWSTVSSAADCEHIVLLREVLPNRRRAVEQRSLLWLEHKHFGAARLLAPPPKANKAAVCGYKYAVAVAKPQKRGAVAAAGNPAAVDVYSKGPRRRKKHNSNEKF
jgi:hypothetical protein